VLACLYFVLPALLGVVGLYATSGASINYGRLPGVLKSLAPVLVSLNPFSTMMALTGQMLSPGGRGMFSVPLHCGVMLGLSALVLCRSVAVVRRVALRQAVGQRLEGERPKAKDKRQRTENSAVLRPPAPVRRVVGPPVVWKELRAPFIQGIDNRNSYIGLAIAIVALVLTYIAGAATRSLDADFTHIAYIMLFVFIGVLINIVFSATQITAEKESQSWSLLLTTPLSDHDILLGKAISAFRRCLPIWGLLAGHVLLFTLVGYLHPIAVLHLVIIVAWLTCFLTGAGLYFGARFARTTSAVLTTFALAVGLWIIGPTLVGLMGVMGGKTDVFALYMWTHPAIQTEMVVGAAAGSQNAHVPLSSLNYNAVAVSRSGHATLGVGRATSALAGVAAAYIAAGLLFYWRARCCLRRRVFG
jgi:ABC-type transport system involved in multi-copper enzyme maturation permease subunit